MQSFSLAHLSDARLTHELGIRATVEHEAAALVLAHLAEFDARKLFLPAGHPSMKSYCVHVLAYSDDAARRRIHAARAAHQFPTLFERVADGRLHLTAVITLAPYLTAANADELIESATRRSKVEIEEMLAGRFARQPVFPPVSEPACDAHGMTECPEANIDERALERVQNETVASAPTSTEPALPIRAPWPITVDPSDHAVLKEAQALLRHQIPSGDLTRVVSRLIRLGFAELQKRRQGAGVRPRTPRRPSANPRQVPTAVRQAVWERDGGQCTFTSESGHRCPARDSLELDHIVPVARGGTSTVANVRIRCRAHNQYAAEQTFGRQFMASKREASASQTRRRAREAPPTDPPHVADVIPWLRGLGFKIDEARRAAGACLNMPDAPLEQRVRVALRSFHQKPIACGGIAAA